MEVRSNGDHGSESNFFISSGLTWILSGSRPRRKSNLHSIGRGLVYHGRGPIGRLVFRFDSALLEEPVMCD